MCVSVCVSLCRCVDVLCFQSGRSCVTAHVYPDASSDMVGLVNFGDGPVEVVSLDVYEMDSCWVQ